VRRALLLPNPYASGFTGDRFRRVVSVLRETFALETAWADNPTAASSLAAGAAADGVDVVVAMGGDGVVHHAARGLVHSPTALGIIPAGTTNVLARILGIPGSAVAAAEALSGYEPLLPTLGAVTAEGAQRTEHHHALFAFGVGFDAAVVEQADRSPHSKLTFGSVHYARTAVTQVVRGFRSRPPNLRVECDGRRFDAVAVMVQVHDRYTYFGKLPLFITRTPGPGLTALAIERITPWRAAQIVPRAVLTRSLEAAPGCGVMPIETELAVEADPPSPYQADGELLGTASRFVVRPAPGALRILAPAPAGP
jgi:diacylglycerol kinase family enzyme